MAGDWIKMRIDLQSHPKVVRILSATGSDKFRIVGGLHAIWSIFDVHSEDGELHGYSFKLMDEVIGWPGFSEAVGQVGWLKETPESLVMPEFESHNGKSAKRRAEDQKRKKASRICPQNVHNEEEKKRTREEKRREENIPPTPKGEPEGFEEFWNAYPRKVGKGDCRKRWKKINPTKELQAKILWAVQQQKKSDQWKKDSGQFVPLPATWLNQERWDDELPLQTSQASNGFAI